jgi:hypothetical protein
VLSHSFLEHPFSFAARIRGKPFVNYNRLSERFSHNDDRGAFLRPSSMPRGAAGHQCRVGFLLGMPTCKVPAAIRVASNVIRVVRNSLRQVPALMGSQLATSCVDELILSMCEISFARYRHDKQRSDDFNVMRITFFL